MENVYLRVGDWHPSERSRNYALGKSEKGVSVYALDKSGKPIEPQDGEWAYIDMVERLKSDAPKYIVKGRLIGKGHDGEPLLRGLKIVGQWPQCRDLSDEKDRP